MAGGGNLCKDKLYQVIWDRGMVVTKWLDMCRRGSDARVVAIHDTGSCANSMGGVNPDT